jgi:glucose/mannose-6-phosphate isomerase
MKSAPPADPMLERVRRAADQLDSVRARPLPRPPRGAFDRILILGTGGGSAMAGEALKRLLDRPGRPSVEVCGEYRPPAWTNRRTLAFAVSHSGSTKETLASVREASRRGASVCALTAGGPLAELAARRGWPVARLGEGTMPRALFYEILASLLRLTSEAGAGPRPDRDLAETARRLREGAASRERAAWAAARRLRGLVPYAIGAEPLGALAAMRLKNQLAENGKRIAFAAGVPRAHHDEIVGWSAPRADTARYGVVLLRDHQEPPELERRLAATRGLLAPRAGALVELRAETGSPLARLATLIQTCDFLSVHAALLDGVAPTPVELIDELKRRMR